MRLTVHLPDDLARLLKQAALNEGKSMSALTAEALALYLRERRRRALGLKVLERAGKALVELLRLSLKGAIGREDAGLLLDAIPAVCRVVWPDWSIGERSARLSHGLALPLVDAIVLTTALEAGAEELWTTDAHLTAYEGRTRVVRL